jgi:hypothetical protein
VVSQSLADDALGWAREWIGNNTNRVPEWMVAKVMNEAYPGGFITFLSDMGLINRGDAA